MMSQMTMVVILCLALAHVDLPSSVAASCLFRSTGSGDPSFLALNHLLRIVLPGVPRTLAITPASTLDLATSLQAHARTLGAHSME